MSHTSLCNKQTQMFYAKNQSSEKSISQAILLSPAKFKFLLILYDAKYTSNHLLISDI